MKAQCREEPAIIAQAERQMQAWACAEALRRSGESFAAQPRVKTYLTISREGGAGGGRIAEIVGDRLGWEVLDKNLVGLMAERFHLSHQMLELVDEAPPSWVHEVVGTFVDRNVVSTEKYVVRLRWIVRAAARRRHLVVVGRGAQFLLPRDQGLAVRIIASRKYRISQIMAREGLSAADAERHVDALDEGRRRFVLHTFHHDIDDPHLYDLVANVERLGVDGTVEEILGALRRKLH